MKSDEYLLTNFGEGLLTETLLGELDYTQNLFSDDYQYGEQWNERIQPGVPVGWNAKRTVSFEKFYIENLRLKKVKCKSDKV